MTDTSEPDLTLIEEIRNQKGILRGFIMEDPQAPGVYLITSLSGPHRMKHIGPYPSLKSARFSIRTLISVGR